MASIGSLNASLKLESASFIRDLNKASQAVAQNTSAMQRSMAQLSSTFTSIGKGAAGFLAGFVSTAAVRSLASLVQTTIDIADSIGAASTAIGIGAEQLQRYRFAAEQTDVSVESLDQALKLFQKNVATGKISSQSFDEFIQTIRDAPNQIERVRIAQEGLGKQFQTGLLLAAQSGEEFTRQYENAFVTSQKAINAASDLDNEIREINNAVSAGFSTGFLEGFAGALDTSRESLVRLNQLASDFGRAFGEGLDFVIKRTQGWIDLIRELSALIPTIPIPSWMSGRSSDNSGIQQSTDFMRDAMAATKEGAKSFSDLGDAIEASRDKIGAWKTTIEVAKIPETVREWENTFQSFGDTAAHSFAEAIVEGKKFGDTMADLAKDIERMALSTAFHQVFALLIGNVTTPGTPSVAGSGLLGALGLHSGGIVGRSAAPRWSVPASTFIGAPRLHGGLRGDEFPAILQAGEQVIPKGQQAGPVTIQVKNLPGQTAEASQPRTQGDQTVIDLIIGTVDRGLGEGKFDRSLGGRFGVTRGTTVR